MVTSTRLTGIVVDTSAAAACPNACDPNNCSLWPAQESTEDVFFSLKPHDDSEATEAVVVPAAAATKGRKKNPLQRLFCRKAQQKVGPVGSAKLASSEKSAMLAFTTPSMEQVQYCQHI